MVAAQGEYGCVRKQLDVDDILPNIFPPHWEYRRPLLLLLLFLYLFSLLNCRGGGGGRNGGGLELKKRDCGGWRGRKLGYCLLEELERRLDDYDCTKKGEIRKAG